MLATKLMQRALPWPVPAMLAWALAWAVFTSSAAWLDAPPLSFVFATAVGALFALRAQSNARRACVALGFPLSSMALGVAPSLPAWAWLVALALLAAAYPLRAWRDAPFFPTRRDALKGLDGVVPLPAHAAVLDAGCGMGHGLQALRAVWPQAQLCGVEWSHALSWLARWRCPWAAIERGDMWRSTWTRFELVYLFQRPESMARAVAKARAEMRPGSWLVSLEFEAAGLQPTARLAPPGGRVVWVYRLTREE